MPDHPPRFYLPDPVAPGDRVTLQAEEARHARARRIAVGESIALFDGNGRSYVGRAERCGHRELVVRIIEERPRQAGESPLHLTLAIAVLKSDRFEWLIEKATELGVTRIQPFLSEHAVARPAAAKQTRWRSIALSAAKQCGRSVVPAIAGPRSFDEVLAELTVPAALFWEGATEDPPRPVAAERLALIIGPEGGFSALEVERARRAHCAIATLGPRILRAETAAIVAVTLVQARVGDLAAGGARRAP